MLVDTLGMVLKARLHSADLQDRAAVPLVLEGAAEGFPRLEPLWIDQGYTGKAWIEDHIGWSVQVVKHPPKARGEWQPHADLNDLSTVWFERVKLPPAEAVSWYPTEAMGSRANLRLALSKQKDQQGLRTGA